MPLELVRNNQILLIEIRLVFGCRGGKTAIGSRRNIK